MTEDGLVEPLDTTENICSCLVSGAIDHEKKLSIAAWSQTLSDWLMPQMLLLLAIRRWTAHWHKRLPP